MNPSKQQTASAPEAPPTELEQHLFEMDEYMKNPLPTQEEETARIQQRAKLVSDFDHSEDGQKLHKRRFERFVMPMLQRLMQEIPQMTPWACEVAGIIVEANHASDPAYKAWDATYERYLNQYIDQNEE
jgi:hypothetical protein